MFRLFYITVFTDDFQQGRQSSAGIFSCSIKKCTRQPEEEQAKKKGEQANIQEVWTRQAPRGSLMKTMAGKEPAALRALCALCLSLCFFVVFLLSIPLLPSHSLSHTHPPTLLWNEVDCQVKAESMVKTITGCQRKVVQEELSFNLKKCKQTQYRCDENEPAYER